MKKEFQYDQVAEIAQLLISQKFEQNNIFTFVGPLGAGKTTLIKEILRTYGVTENVDSPTFGYVKNYSGRNNIQFFHFDLYRIGSEEEFVGLGFDEYLHRPHTYCFIEWPEVIKDLLQVKKLQNSVCSVVIEYHKNSQDSRIISW